MRRIKFLALMSFISAYSNANLCSEIEETKDALECIEREINNLKVQEGKLLSLSAQTICFAGLTRILSDKRNLESKTRPNLTVAVIPLERHTENLDIKCEADVNQGWKGFGIAMGGYYGHGCTAKLMGKNSERFLSSFLTEAQFKTLQPKESMKSCHSGNAFVCCTEKTNGQDFSDK